MVGRPQSVTRKKQLAKAEQEIAITRAINEYRAEQRKDEKRSLRTICREVQEGYRAETGKPVIVDHMTVLRRLAGKRSSAQYMAEERAWLKPEEAEKVVEYCLELGRRGFPLNHRRLKEHVDAIVRARLGDDFPSEGVEKNWTDRFSEKHLDRLGRYWSRSLDSARGRAVNPTTHEQWFNLLEDAMGALGVGEDCIWAADETGFQPGGGSKERVFGPSGAKNQYQQRDGNRENITVMVTICADGTEIPPTVIYKGKAFGTQWHQNNHLGASVAHSSKGWTDGVIGQHWIKDFNEKTREKATGRPRLLLLDGHNSHYTEAFLSYARKHNIHVLCYPAHTTHIYQGLDVAVFGTLKRCWSEERDEYERTTGQKITKKNFIQVYQKAHMRAMTTATVKAAFKRTGVWPLNRHVVTHDAMAPSLVTSNQGHLPLQQPSPVRVLANAIHQYQKSCAIENSSPSILDKSHDLFPSLQIETDSDATSDPFGSSSMQTPNTFFESLTRISPNDAITCLSTPSPLENFSQTVVQSLASTSGSFLVSSSPLHSSSQLPRYVATPISPSLKRKSDLLNLEPETPREQALQQGLTAAHEREVMHKSMMHGMQSTIVLQGMYCDALHGQLAAQEESKNNSKKRGKLMGDGLPCYLSGDAFYTRVVDHEKAVVEEEVAKKTRRKEREQRSAALEEWKEMDEARKQRNRELKAKHAAELERWKMEKERANMEKLPLAWKRPTRGKLEAPVAKPAAVQGIAGDDQENGSDEDEEDGQ